MKDIDSILIKYCKDALRYNASFSLDSRTAIIGEKSDKVTKDCFAYRLFGDKGNYVVFTGEKPFELEMAKEFDVLLGVRPCEAEKLILVGATIYKKKFAFLPCQCGGFETKILKYIREFPIITDMQAGIDDTITSYPSIWYILSNFR